MSKRQEPGWSLWCDFPGCQYQWEYSDYTIFGEGWDAEEIVRESDGWVSLGGTLHYCHQHVTAWASDHEDGSPFPEPPYLLIHDGDTGDASHDGHVSLVSPPGEVAP